MIFSDKDFLTLLATLGERLGVARHRAMMVLRGEEDWAVRLAQLAVQNHAATLWLGSAAPVHCAALQMKQADQVLGSEFQWLVVNGYGGFDANGFAAACGTLVGGGVLLLIVPPDWPSYADPENERLASAPYPASAVTGHYLARMERLLAADPGVVHIDQAKALPSLAPFCNSSHPVEAVTPPYRSVDQQKAVMAICKVLTGHRRRPLVLTADRGRGKSAALGMAAAQLIAQGRRNILVTAPGRQTTATLFRHAGEHPQDALRFVAPDELLQSTPDAELLIVDEAAAIPLAMLQQMLAHYSRVVFSTTEHGYEGTGRGFSLKFRTLLDQQAPHWRAMRLEQAIRWASTDPLEPLLFRVLLLDAEPVVTAELTDFTAEACEFALLEREPLADDEILLRDVFGLLVQAHYRTSPSDLRQLLDAPGKSVAVLRYRGRVVATALLDQEGGIDAGLAEQIYLGKRRLRGNLVAQSLAVHAGLRDAAGLHFGRIVRIATHPDLQGNGLGTRLVHEIGELAVSRHWDCLAVSFSATARLMGFWSRLGFVVARVGLTSETRSGSHALIMLKAVTPSGVTMTHQACERLLDQLPMLLSEPLAGLDAGLVAGLFRQFSSYASRSCPSEQDLADVVSFSAGQRGYEVCMPALHRWLIYQLMIGAFNGEVEPPLAVLIAKVLQRRDWADLAQSYRYTGKLQLVAHLRRIIDQSFSATHSACGYDAPDVQDE